MTHVELNLDGLVGPTHNYSGLAFGNTAAQANQFQVSNPQAAALQGLEKIRRVWQAGATQGILPPHFRPSIPFLNRCGFHGKVKQILEQSASEAPQLLAASYSAAAMWTANAATISPSPDTADQRLHFTPANLNSGVHRFIESQQTAKNLAAIFPGNGFVHHPPLDSAVQFLDEGAANHMRLAPQHGDSAIEVFVFGADALSNSNPKPTRFPARQSRQAAEVIARNHQLAPDQTFFVQQNPDAIDAGAFHNDVVAVSHRDLVLCHQLAFLDQQNQLERLRDRFQSQFDQPLNLIEISEQALGLKEAVKCYLFNSQIIDLDNNKMLLVAPIECETGRPRAVIDQILNDDNPIEKVIFPNVRQSMRNGGGPACLRLRIVVSQSQLSEVHAGIMVNEDLLDSLNQWVKRHYRTELSFPDFVSTDLYEEALVAFEELETLLKFPKGLLIEGNANQDEEL